MKRNELEEGKTVKAKLVKNTTVKGKLQPNGGSTDQPKHKSATWYLEITEIVQKGNYKIQKGDHMKIATPKHKQFPHASAIIEIKPEN